MSIFDEILLKIGRILDVAVFNDDIKFELSNQIKNLLGGQLDGSLSIKEENLVNKIAKDYTDFKKSNFKDFNNFKYSTYNNIDIFLKGNTFNDLIHRIYAILKRTDVKDIKEELRESFNELILLSDSEEEIYIESELAGLLIWKYGRFVYLISMSEKEFRNDTTNLIEQYFVRRSNGILTHMFEVR